MTTPKPFNPANLAEPWPDYPDAPVVDVYETPSRMFPPSVVTVVVRCTFCGRDHRHGGLGLRAASCTGEPGEARSYYVGGERS